MPEESVIRVSLDRIEEGLAVLLLLRDDESVRFTFPRALLPRNAREGDIREIAIRRDVAATDEARRRVAERIERMRRREPE